VSSERAARPDASMTLITEMMQRPLDPSYAAAAERRQQAGLPPATGHRSPLLVIVAVLIGALLTTSALALRAPTTTVSAIKLDLLSRIAASRAHADAQTLLIATLIKQIDTAQAAALSQQSQTGLTAELSKLELAAGTVPVTGPGLVLTVDDALTTADPNNPAANPRVATAPDQGKVIATDLQILVNGLWQAGAEAISVNDHRLTARAAIRAAGAAILVDYRPLTRPYIITAIGDPGSLSVQFAGNSGGSYLQSLTTNYNIRSNLQSRNSVVVPGDPALSVQQAQAVQSAVKRPLPAPTATRTSVTSTPQTTETSP
jgi:uncharacterized protein YlxW (UPF0749 family)